MDNDQKSILFVKLSGNCDRVQSWLVVKAMRQQSRCADLTVTTWTRVGDRHLSLEITSSYLALCLHISHPATRRYAFTSSHSFPICIWFQQTIGAVYYLLVHGCYLICYKVNLYGKFSQAKIYGFQYVIMYIWISIFYTGHFSSNMLDLRAKFSICCAKNNQNKLLFHVNKWSSLFFHLYSKVWYANCNTHLTTPFQIAIAIFNGWPQKYIFIFLIVHIIRKRYYVQKGI